METNNIISLNEIQDLKNKLNVHTFLESIDSLIRKEKKNSTIYNTLEEMRNIKTLPKLKFDSEMEFIKEHYSTAFHRFKGNNKVSMLSFGLSKSNNCIYLYMKKEQKDLLNYMKNLVNINPVNFGKYIDDDLTTNTKKSPINSDIISKAGMNLNGYSFEFNFNYFLQTLSSMIELPNLLFNLSIGSKYASFNELDIAYYNSNLIPKDNDKLGPLKTTGYFKIYNSDITFDENKNFEIYNNSLILGEVKVKFPKKIYEKKEDKESKVIKGNINIKVKKEDSLEKIIYKLFYKLSLYYDLFNNTNLFDASNIQNIQLIFFYDNIQLNQLKNEIIIDIMKKNIYHLKALKNIPVHFFIVYVLPTITNISFYELKEEINELKEKDKKRGKEIEDLKEENKKREKEIEDLKEENKKREKEFEELKEINKNILIELANLQNNQNIKDNMEKTIENNKISDVNDVFDLLGNNKFGTNAEN